ncbi:progesterone-induced-blocking factor 1-like isoform X2 [Corticium candelabrum]|uniref:progesterone-induced-blocking factor 1-like isoform X2 n=1 Tax=Corticium candelabrum TaxID=121492 RepID=UPI002E25F671|nr:progesterone-induced-blocking factor 1-like isoform X2 [Corticium candelabrum]
MKPDSGSQILTSAEISRRVALKLRRRNRNILPSPVGVITANTDVTLSRTFIESRASDGCSSPTETIPGSIGEPTASAHGFRSRATPDHFKLQTSETMRRMSSLTIPVLDSRDSSRSDSVLSWFSGKISGLFSRSGSRALNTASKASRRSYTMGRTPRAWSMLGTVGKPIEETEEEEQLDSRSDTFSPDITEECVAVPEWDVTTAWIQDEPERQQLELESLDFLASIFLDAELEQNRIDLYVYLLTWFFQALRKMRKLSTAQEAKLFDRLRYLMIKLEKKLSKEKKAKTKVAARTLTKKHEKRRKELDLKHFRERFNRGMTAEKTEDGIYAPCDGTAYLTGKFKVRIVQKVPDPQLNEGNDIIMTNFLPWKKIDCRGIKIKKDQWIGSAIREVKGMMGYKPSQLKRRVTHGQSFDTWQSSTSRYQVGSASRVSADFYGSQAQGRKSAAVLGSQQGSKEGRNSTNLPAVSPLVQKQQESEKDDLEDELRLERDEEGENLRKLFAAKKFMRMKDVKNTLIREASLEAGLDNQHSEQAQLLVDEFNDAVAFLEEALDEERSRIRVWLMYRLGKREAVAETLEEQKEYCNDVEDMLAAQREEIVKKIADIEPDQLNYLEEIDVELSEILDEKKDDHKDALESLAIKKPNENNLRRNELRKRQGEELEAFVKSQDVIRLSSKKNATNFVKWIGSQMAFLRRQRQEREQLETILDDESERDITEMNEGLEKLLETLVLDQSSRLTNFLASNGYLELDLNCIDESHANDLQQLKKTREAVLLERRPQIEERLQQLQSQLEQSRLKELEEGKQTRSQVQLIIRKLLDTQLSLSPEDRAKFEDNQAVQLVDQENRLTLNKLRQRKILRKSISDKQRQLHGKLEEKRLHDTLLNLVSGVVGVKQRADAETWKSHKKAVRELLKSRRVSFTQEMATIEGDVAKQRANDVQKHAESIGADLYTGKMAMERNLLQKQKDAKAIELLQMGLSKEMSLRNEAQLDEVNEKIIKEHKEGMERLGTTLAKEREKQEEALLRRLKEHVQRKLSRKSARESSPERRSLPNLDPVYEGEQVQDEKKLSLDLQTEQAKRYVKEKAELDRLVAMEEHGLDLVSRLVRSGRFDESDLASALRSLFPTKSEKELDMILDKVYKDTARRQRGRRGTRQPSKLEELIKEDLERLYQLAEA